MVPLPTPLTGQITRQPLLVLVLVLALALAHEAARREAVVLAHMVVVEEVAEVMQSLCPLASASAA